MSGPSAVSRAAVLMMAGLVAVAGCGRPSPSPAPEWPEPSAVSGVRALEAVAAVVAMGPRESGTDGAGRAAAFLAGRLSQLGMDARIDAFTDVTPDGTQTFRNVSARLTGTEPGLILLVSHYDTKSGIATNFEGANDSGSSTGLLLELARVLKERRGGGPDLEFLWVDGEECRAAYGPRDGLHGSRRRAAQLNASGEAARVRAVIVLDMIGDRDLRVTLPRNGDPRLGLAVFKAAEAEGVRHRFRLGEGTMLDDHVPFLEAGLPAVDLIDFEYGDGPGDNRYWHTTNDTLDKLSAESLETVGRVVMRALESISGQPSPPAGLAAGGGG